MTNTPRDEESERVVKVAKPFEATLSAISQNRLAWCRDPMGPAIRKRIADHIVSMFRDGRPAAGSLDPEDVCQTQRHVIARKPMLLIVLRRGSTVDGLILRMTGDAELVIEANAQRGGRTCQFVCTASCSSDLLALIAGSPAAPSFPEAAVAISMVDAARTFVAERCEALVSAPTAEDIGSRSRLEDVLTAASLVAGGILGPSFRQVTSSGSSDRLDLAIETTDGRSASILLTEQTASQLPNPPLREASAIWPGHDGVSGPLPNNASVARLELGSLPSTGPVALRPNEAIALVRSLSTEQVSLIERAARSLA
jgi:hypothetical protein